MEAQGSWDRLAFDPEAFGALPGLGDDALNRSGIAEAVERAIKADAGGALVIGLNGAWGAGKTTILNELQRRVSSSTVQVIRMDAWNYREPQRLVDAYLTKLRRELEALAPASGVAEQIRVVGQALASMRSPPLAALIEQLAGSWPAGIDDAREDLARRIEALPSRIVVFLDDLDRLDQEELQAALRLVRLVSELRVTHVLAYDRGQLARTLFPDDPEGSRARDYLAKIVGLELPVPVPTDESALQMLEDCLTPVFGDLPTAVRESFAERFRHTPPRSILRILQTPREIRRVAAATGLTWKRMSRDLDLYDLFLLTVIQYRYPHLYARMQSQAHLFTDVGWSSDVLMSLRRDEVIDERRKFFELLRKDPDKGGPDLDSLLVALLPGIAGRNVFEPNLSEREARRGRRLVHPDVFPRYFQSAVSRTEVREASMEDLAEGILAAEPGEPRQNVLASRIAEEVASGRIRSFFDQFHLVHKKVTEAKSDILLADVLLGLARASEIVPGKRSDWLSPGSTLHSWVLTLLGEFSSVTLCNGCATKIVARATSLDLVQTVVFYSFWADPKRRRDAFGDTGPDGLAVRQALDERVRAVADQGEALICGCDDDLLTNVLYRVSPELTRELLLRDLPDCPEEALRILVWSVRLEVWSDDPDDVSVTHVSLDDLERHVGLDLIRQLIAWAREAHPDAHGRAVLKVAENWVSERFDRQRGG